MCNFAPKVGWKMCKTRNKLGMKMCRYVQKKATTGNAKSIRTVLKHPEKYHVTSAIKLGDFNVGRNDALLTLPMYMTFMLTEV